MKEKSSALLLLWITGTAMVAYLLISSIKNWWKDVSTSNVPTQEKVDRNFNSNLNEAYVLVTINKKHFLTRFTSFIPDEEIKKELETTVTKPETNSIPVKRIPRNIITKPGKTPEDFSIKPLPQ